MHLKGQDSLPERRAELSGLRRRTRGVRLAAFDRLLHWPKPLFSSSVASACGSSLSVSPVECGSLERTDGAELAVRMSRRSAICSARDPAARALSKRIRLPLIAAAFRMVPFPLAWGHSTAWLAWLRERGGSAGRATAAWLIGDLRADARAYDDVAHRESLGQRPARSPEFVNFHPRIPVSRSVRGPDDPGNGVRGRRAGPA